MTAWLCDVTSVPISADDIANDRMEQILDKLETFVDANPGQLAGPVVSADVPRPALWVTLTVQRAESAEDAAYLAARAFREAADLDIESLQVTRTDADSDT